MHTVMLLLEHPLAPGSGQTQCRGVFGGKLHSGWGSSKFKC